MNNKTIFNDIRVVFWLLGFLGVFIALMFLLAQTTGAFVNNDTPKCYEYADKEKAVDEQGHYSCYQYPGYSLVGNKCKKHGHSDKNASWIETTYKWQCPDGFSSHGRNCRKEVVCAPDPTPIPDPTPTNMPEPTPAPLTEAQAGPAPVCTDGKVVTLPINAHVLRFPTLGIVKWNPNGGNLVDVYARVVGNSDWQFSAGDQPNNGFYVFRFLNPSVAYEFGIRQHIGCGEGKTVIVKILDGPVVKLFPVTGWEWSN